MSRDGDLAAIRAVFDARAATYDESSMSALAASQCLG